MSSNSEDDRREITRRDVEFAKVRLSEAIEAFVDSQSGGTGHQLVAAKDLHKAVIGFWWRMRPHILELDIWESAADSKYLDRDVIWEGAHPRTDEPVRIEGLQDISEWVERTSQIEHPAPGPNRSSQTHSEEVRIQLPPAAAITVGELLTVLFKEFGLGVDVEDPMKGDAGFDYTDLLEDGPPGDGEKPEIEGVSDD